MNQSRGSLAELPINWSLARKLCAAETHSDWFHWQEEDKAGQAVILHLPTCRLEFDGQGHSIGHKLSNGIPHHEGPGVEANQEPFTDSAGDLLND